VSWFRSSRRRRSAEPVAAAPAGPPRPARAELSGRPLADLHALAAEWGVPRYRLLRHEQLIEAISGEAAPAAPAEPAPAEPRPAPPPAPEPEATPAPQPEAAPALERGAAPELEREAAPEPGSPETEGSAGFVDLVADGYGFLRINGLTRSREDPYLPRSLVRQFELRRGEEIAGRVVPRGPRDRHARMVAVEWRRSDPAPVGFDDLPVQRPGRALRARGGEEAFAARMAGLVATLAVGQRALIAAPPGAGATHLLRDVARGLLGGRERLIVALVDVRPEEVPEWELSEHVEVHAAPSDRSARDQVALAELVLERAKRLAEQGEDVVVLLDSITRLARAYGLARSRTGGEAPAPEVLAAEGAKRWFATARDTGAGSLTLLATARVDSDSPLETLVHETLLDMAGAVVRLDPELAARGLHPAIDAQHSRALGEEHLLEPDERRHLDSVRGVMRSLEPVEAWEYAAARARES
jgi:transcription termination factor Rho